MAAVVTVAGEAVGQALDAARLVLHGDGAAWLHYELPRSAQAQAQAAPVALRGLPSLLAGSYAAVLVGGSAGAAGPAPSLTHTPAATMRAGDRVRIVLRGDGPGGPAVAVGGAAQRTLEGVLARVTPGELVLKTGGLGAPPALVTLPTATVAYVERLSDAAAFGDGLDVDAAPGEPGALRVRCATADLAWQPAYALTLGSDAAAGSVLDVAADVQNTGVAAVSARALVVTERPSGLRGGGTSSGQRYYTARSMARQAAPSSLFSFGGARAEAASASLGGRGGGGEVDDEASAGGSLAAETTASQADAEWTLAPGLVARVFAPGTTTRVAVGQLRLSEGARIVCDVTAGGPERVTSVTRAEPVRRVLIETASTPQAQARAQALGVLPAGRMLVFGADEGVGAALGRTVSGQAQLGRLAPGDGVHVDVGSAAALFKVTVEREPATQTAPAGGIVQQRRVVRVTAAWTGGALSSKERPALEIWTRQWTNEAFGSVEAAPQQGIAYERRREPARAGLKEVDRQTIHVFVLRPAPNAPVTLEYALVVRQSVSFGSRDHGVSFGDAVPGYPAVAM